MSPLLLDHKSIHCGFESGDMSPSLNYTPAQDLVLKIPMPLHPNPAAPVNSMPKKSIALWTIAALACATSVHALTIAPFTTAEATYTNSDLKDGNVQLDSYELGAGFTGGVVLNEHHEISFSTGIVNFEADPIVTPGFVSVEFEAEQIPLLLNYRYRLPLDSKGRFTFFGGPTVGFIHQKITVTDRQLGGLPPSLVGSESNSDWLFAYGATLGLNVQLTPHWTAGVAAQVLKVESSDFSSFGGLGPSANFDSATRPSFTVSVGYGW
jgi:opacity protein-like surface antigen